MYWEALILVQSELELGLEGRHSDPLRCQIVISKMKTQLLLFSLKLVYFLGEAHFTKEKTSKKIL